MPPSRRRAPRRRRRDRNFVAIPFQAALTLGTLADDTVISGSPITLGEDLFVISVDTLAALRGLTAGDVPITVGYAHGDLTDTEIGEALSANLTDPDDIIARERARRPVRKVGTFAHGADVDQVLNNGVPIRTSAKFSIGDGHTFDLFAINRSGGQLQTGAVIEFEGTVFGRWQR